MTFLNAYRTTILFFAFGLGSAACTTTGDGGSGQAAPGGTGSSGGQVEGGGSGGNGTTGLGGAAGQQTSFLDSSSLATCTEGYSEAEIEAELQIAGALHDSIHELVACGGMTITIVWSLAAGVVQAITSATGSFEPSGVQYEGEGRYVTPTGLNDAGELTVRFHREVDGQLQLIEDNLFVTSAYLQNPTMRAGISGTTPWTEISFTGVGPYVELLGFGENPSSPLRLEGDEITSLGPNWSEFFVSSSVEVYDEQGDSVVFYQVESEPVPMNAVLTNGLLDYELLDISATNSVTGQTALVHELDWSIGFGGNALTGSAAFDMTGGLFDYGLYYGHSADHSDDIVLSCPSDHVDHEH